MIRNQKGVALLYVLIALVFVGAIGSLTLNMANKEKSDSGLRASSESARFAATAGLTWGANFFTDTTTAHKIEVDTILNRWLRASRATPSAKASEQWITGRTGTGFTKFVNDSSYMPSADNQMRFRVKIIDMDFSRFRAAPQGDSSINVKFKSQSLDNSGGRAENIGFYTIRGFRPVGAPPPADITHALYLGGGNMWIHSPVTVNGSTYIENIRGTSSAIYHSAGNVALARDTSRWNGEFWLYQEGTVGSLSLGRERFNGPAFFESSDGTHNVQFVGTVDNIFRRGFGGNSHFIRNSTGPVTVPAGQPVVLYGGGSVNLGTIGVTPTTRNTGEETLTALGFASTRRPTAPQIVLTQTIRNLGTSNKTALGVTNSERLTGKRLNELWTTAGNARRIEATDGNQWLVLNVTGDNLTPNALHGNLNPDDGEFIHRAILIVTSGGGGDNFINVAKTRNAADQVIGGGNILIYIPSDVSGTFSTHQTCGNFRGLIYNASQNMAMNFSIAQPGFCTNTWSVSGSFYVVRPMPGTGNNSSIQLGAGGAYRVTINFDQNVVNEIAALGIIGGVAGPADPNPQTATIGRIPDVQATATMRSRGF